MVQRLISRFLMPNLVGQNGCDVSPQMQTYPCFYGATKNFGAVAEWLRSGLQSREHRFDSGPRLQLDYRLDQAFDRE